MVKVLAGSTGKETLANERSEISQDKIIKIENRIKYSLKQ